MAREGRSVTDDRARIVCVAGARPNFMKVAPILEALRSRPRLRGILVHTGQHYDRSMSEAFFRDLRLPEPDLHLGVPPEDESPARFLARVIERFDDELPRLRPACVVVVGDVNSTLACALVALKRAVPLAHVEAGLRSRDWTMPEEGNRVLTDAASDLLFTTSPDADENLRAEGVAPERIHHVGNVMIDTLRRFEERSRRSTVLADAGLEERRFALFTLHRPSNVDRPEDLRRMVAILEGSAARIPSVIPLHPRTRARLEQEGMLDRLRSVAGLRIREPEGYLDFLRLLSAARVVLTDSGGIQEETTVLGIPCLTLRANTERPITIAQGTNRLVGSEPGRVLQALDEELARPEAELGAPRIPDLWDGQAAERIAAILEERFGGAAA
ncbi:MAG: UDP-N-acetylglucosamine 2-epimerase (non-hydrolyzing) [Candidatus Eisenbacteria bacterium]|nr:UDP-N-acetylglucosamine 2-epimerase (non-hydrolyzing) [Candidatus Eisenbacteria bacterium]